MEEEWNFKIAPTSVKSVLLRRDHLIVLWLLTLPWRQLNLREMRIGSKIQNANLFLDVVVLGEIPGVPTWVEELIATRADAKVWQFRFDASETKNGHCVRGIIPRRLVQPLEDYLRDSRPMLLGTNLCNRLFLDREGRMLSSNGMTSIVADLTSRYIARRITPHSFRHSFAEKWLIEHPGDYLTLSKILWHIDIQSTLRRYTLNFNESHGAKAVDEWLEMRALKKIGGSVQQSVTAPDLMGLLMAESSGYPRWARRK
jgi:hypothetical protein